MVLLVLAALLRVPTLAYPLTEAHAFRQTQTAFPAVIYADAGIDLLRPEVPVFGPPWTLPFEFPAYQAIASILIRIGFAPEIALRGLGLVSFLVSALLLWMILDRHTTPRAATIALACYIFSPFALLWSRTSMIEYFAVAGALAFMLGVLEWKVGRGRRWLLLAACGGSFAAVVKITTAVFWIAPACLVRHRAVLVVVAVPALLGLAWTRYADAVKMASDATQPLASSALFAWTFGGDRLSADDWRRALSPVVLSAGMLLAPALILVARRPERLVWGWLLVALAAPPLLFMNLYVRHDYYAAAITPALAALIGGGLDVLMRLSPRSWPLPMGTAIIAFVLTADYWGLAYRPADPENVAAAAAIIAAAREPVAVICPDWTPAGFFYAGRRGYIAWLDRVTPPGYVVIDDLAACPSGRH